MAILLSMPLAWIGDGTGQGGLGRSSIALHVGNQQSRNPGSQTMRCPSMFLPAVWLQYGFLLLLLLDIAVTVAERPMIK